MGIYRRPFIVLSFNADSKIMLIKEEPGEAPKRYYTAQVKPHLEDPEEVAVNFMSSLGKAIENYRDIGDGSTCHKSTAHNKHSRFSKHVPLNRNNMIKL